MRRRPPRSKRTDTLFPHTAHFRTLWPQCHRRLGQLHHQEALAGLRRQCRRHDRKLRHVAPARSEEHTSELQSLMRLSYAVFCLIKNIMVTASTPTSHHHMNRLPYIVSALMLLLNVSLL